MTEAIVRAPFSKKRKSDERLANAEQNFTKEFERIKTVQTNMFALWGVRLLEARNNEIEAILEFDSERSFSFCLQVDVNNEIEG